MTHNGRPALSLRRITHFRRYGSGLSFEFLCVWGGAAPVSSSSSSSSPAEVQTWQKYTDLQQVTEYAQYIRTHWDVKVERDRNWEDELERVKGTIDEIVLPEVGTAYAVERDTIKAQKRMDREEERRKKRPRAKSRSKYAESDDESDPESSESPDSSDDVKLEDDETHDAATHKKTKASLLPPDPTPPLEWLDIFDQSSVTPVPRYKVKLFKCVGEPRE